MGLGAPYRGDDAVGPAVAEAVGRAVTEQGIGDVEVIEHEDPTLLIESWADRDLVVVVDAVRSGSAPGAIRVVTTGPELPPVGTEHGREGSTHQWGLTSAIELARAMGRLPERVVVVGVEAQDFGWGAPLSAAVEAAVPAATDEVLRLLAA